MRRPAGAAALAVLLALASLAPQRARGEDVPVGHGPAGGRVRDPLMPLVLRQHRYFRGHEAEGVTMDSRYPINPSEAIRMGVVCQLLGYTELAKVAPAGTFASEVAGHADFLLSRLDTVRSHTPFDGMLGYSLVQAYEQTGNPAHLAAARTVLDELIAIPTSQCVLNGGLMVAMATADWANLTGDPVAAAKTTDIVTQLLPYQNADGSFPHWCVPSEDIHYTGWMAEELVLLERLTGDPRIEPVLARMRDFIVARLDSTGLSHYEGPCPGVPNCTKYYDSQRSGCSYDYDTRGWTVEPAYSAQLLDHFQAPQYRPVMRFLLSLEHGGTFSDKFGYIPPPSDPEYPWSIADTSVANMSINFWVLATIVTGRGALARLDAAAFAQDLAGDPEAIAEPASRPARAPLAMGVTPRRWHEVDLRLFAGASPRDPVAGVAPGGGKHGPQRSPGLPLPAVPAGQGAAESSLAAFAGAPGGAATLRFVLPVPQAATLAILDVAGRHVRTLAAGELGAGPHVVAWDGSDAAGRRCPRGVYFAVLRTAAAVRSAHVVLAR